MYDDSGKNEAMPKTYLCKLTLVGKLTRNTNIVFLQQGTWVQK